MGFDAGDLGVVVSGNIDWPQVITIEDKAAKSLADARLATHNSALNTLSQAAEAVTGLVTLSAGLKLWHQTSFWTCGLNICHQISYRYWNTGALNG